MKGLFIPDITAKMFRNACLESIEALMAEGEIYDIEYDPKSEEQEIIRCKDCKFAHKTYDGNIKHCDKWTDEFGIPLEVFLDDDFYCKYGKKR